MQEPGNGRKGSALGKWCAVWGNAGKGELVWH